MRASETGKLIVGYLLRSKEHRRLMQASGLTAEALGDGMLAAVWTLLSQADYQGAAVNVTALFTAGVAGRLLADDDLAVLLALKTRSPIQDEAAFLRTAVELRKDAHNKLIGRQLVELGNELLKGGDAAGAHSRFRAVAQNYARMHAEARRGSAVVLSAFEEWQQRKVAGLPALVPTGIEALDKQTGGLPPKLSVFVGPPGTFKSGLMAAILERQLQAGLRPLVVSLEDRDTWVVKRFMAKRLGLKVRDVFAKDFPDEAKAAEEAQALSLLMHNAWFVTKQHVRTAQDICQTAVKLYAQEKITNVWIDNARAVKGPEVDPKSKYQPDRRLIASAMYEDFAETSDRYGLPFGLLAHTSRKYFDRTEGKGPPIMSDIGETGDAEKDVRLFLGLWKRRGRLRISIGKQNEGESDHENPPTLELDHLGETALIDPDSGTMVDLQAEQRREADDEQDRGDERSVARAARRKALKEKLEAKDKADAAKQTEAAAQGSLFGDSKPEPSA